MNHLAKNKTNLLLKSTPLIFSRGMATEKQILMRITATSNIAKITKSMKMVSAAKMRGAQNRLNNGKPFASWLNNMGDKPLNVERDGLLPEERKSKTSNAIIMLSSDRGLCGGCNSASAKVTRRQMSEINDETKIFVVGEKGRAQLRRFFADKFTGSVTECWSSPPTFAVASTIAESVLSSMNNDVEKTHIVYNEFVSAIAYATSIRTVTTGASKKLADDADNTEEPYLNYEFEPDNREEVLQDLGEYQLANGVFQGMIENATSEESSRMAAMENATNNASDLINSLTLIYNKARQARITTELIEIISGAASLDG